MPKDVIRIVTRGVDGKLRIKDYVKHDAVHKTHTQIGVDDCSTDLGLRGFPVFRGLVGPMPEGRNIVRYESPRGVRVADQGMERRESPAPRPYPQPRTPRRPSSVAARPRFGPRRRLPHGKASHGRPSRSGDWRPFCIASGSQA